MVPAANGGGEAQCKPQRHECECGELERRRGESRERAEMGAKIGERCGAIFAFLCSYEIRETDGVRIRAVGMEHQKSAEQ